MDKPAPDTSSISFTALYTGQVWVRNGLSEPFFQTRSGALLYGAMSPMEALGKRVLGGKIRTFLLQRHHPIDALDLGDDPVIVLGSEAKGLRPGVLKRCDETFFLPMVRPFDSLNVSVSAALCLDAVRRQH